jgi:hypothetical protein
VAPDASASDLVGHNADPVGLVTECPVAQRQARDAAQVVGALQLGCASLDQNAPPGVIGRVDTVDLVADGRAAEQATELATEVGPEDDRAAVDDMVDG